MRILVMVLVLGMALGLGQGMPMPGSNPRIEVKDLRNVQDYVDAIRPLRTVTVFGPALPIPLEMVRGMSLDVIAGQETPPNWVEQARQRGARVRVYLLPGKIPQGSFFIADDRYFFSRNPDGWWRVMDSPEVTMVVKAYLARAMQVAMQMGVVR